MLSKKAQYALKALGYLATKTKEGPVLITTIAKEKNIPLKFLENILLELNKADILGSKKGKGGGYYLKQDPAKISLAKIIRIIDGPIALLPCVSLYFYERCKDCNEKVCNLNRVLIQARDAILSVLENKMLQDII
ncbi:MAG: Rrf2 family transcriptional regulator [Chitinophagaceae bacterium]|jgi:Rrf2 family protein|nr:Rrf2 family transcriptional regulator [Chitinophagaceae bacterium]